MHSSDTALYRRFLPMLRPYRRRLAGALAAAAAGPLLAAARIWLLKVLIDTVIRGHRPGLVPAVAGAFVAIALARGLATYADEMGAGRVGTEVVRDVRVEVFSHLQGLSLRFYHAQALGDLLTRITGDVGAIGDLLVTGLSALVTYITTIVVFLALLVLLDPSLVGVALGILPALGLTTWVESRLGRRAQRAQRGAASNLASTAEEGLSAIALVKAFARHHHETRRFAAAARRSASARLQAVRVVATFPPVSDLVAALGVAVVVYVGARAVLAGKLSLGSLVVFVSYLASLYAPIQGLSRVVSSIQRAMVGAERVAELLDAPAELAERSGGPPLPALRSSVGFSHVSFSYTPGHPVLRDVSFSISPGEVVALIGPSGAGKTTVVSLLLSYYDPDTGHVLLDGMPLSRFDPDSARSQVAAVLQEPMLFDATIAQNIRYGRLEATGDEVRAAAKAACAEGFIAQLPDGYRTVVGPRGARLSGGQRQRLALARALVKQASVVVLDEATSALDPATEAAVLSSLRRACAESAVLIVAHRHSTVRHADRVVVLEEGRVVAAGAPAEVLGVGRLPVP